MARPDGKTKPDIPNHADANEEERKEEPDGVVQGR